MICSLLPFRNLQNVRLVNKLFASLGAEFLLPSVYFDFTARSIYGLREVSLHPFFSLHVKSLYYDADDPDRDKDEAYWLRRLSTELPGASQQSTCFSTYSHGNSDETLAKDHWFFAPRRLHSKDRSDEVWKEIWEVLESGFLEQEKAEAWELKNTEIIRAISRLPRLSEFHLSINNGLSYAKRPHLWPRLHIWALLPESHRKKRLPPPSFCGLQSLMVGFFLRQDRDSSLLFDEVVDSPDGLTKAGTKFANLETLRIGFVNCFLFTVLHFRLSNKISSAVKHLTRLKIVLSMEDLEDFRHEETQIERYQSLKEINCQNLKRLAEAESLVELDIGFSEYNNGWMSVCLSRVLGDGIWKSLKAIALSGFRADPSYMLDLFRGHHETLTRIFIEDIVLEKPNSKDVWAAFLLSLRYIKQWQDLSCYGMLDHDLSRDKRGDLGFEVNTRKQAKLGKNGRCGKAWPLQISIRSFALRLEWRNPFVHWDRKKCRFAYLRESNLDALEFEGYLTDVEFSPLQSREASPDVLEQQVVGEESRLRKKPKRLPEKSRVRPITTAAFQLFERVDNTSFQRSYAYFGPRGYT